MNEPWDSFVDQLPKALQGPFARKCARLGVSVKTGLKMALEAWSGVRPLKTKGRTLPEYQFTYKVLRRTERAVIVNVLAGPHRNHLGKLTMSRDEFEDWEDLWKSTQETVRRTWVQ